MTWGYFLEHNTIKENINKLHLIKSNNLCSLKYTNEERNWQDTNWEKVFAKHLSDKELVSRIEKRTAKINNENTNNSLIK